MRRNKTVDKTTGSQFHGSDTASGEQGRVIRTKHADYQLVPFPKTQREIAFGLRLLEHRHIIHVLTEVDVTVPRQVIHEQKARGEEPLSFMAFIMACLGKAVDEDKSVQAHRKGRNQFVLFQDVDVFTPVERGRSDSPIEELRRLSQHTSASYLAHGIFSDENY
jgi:hypothetical protein